mmetsp:Transcript_3477/g.4037  ORF Transcript_3477/g.4037 Transcript_3477/m.4037 type:complete len:127 (+) Transcript_3477:142-522(+)
MGTGITGSEFDTSLPSVNSGNLQQTAVYGGKFKVGNQFDFMPVSSTASCKDHVSKFERNRKSTIDSHKAVCMGSPRSSKMNNYNQQHVRTTEESEQQDGASQHVQRTPSVLLLNVGLNKELKELKK